MYLKDFDIRWSDIDANRHLANTAYINFMSHTRMSYLTESGFGQKEMAELNLGPVVFTNTCITLKVFSGKPVQVSSS